MYFIRLKNCLQNLVCKIAGPGNGGGRHVNKIIRCINVLTSFKATSFLCHNLDAQHLYKSPSPMHWLTHLLNLPPGYFVIGTLWLGNPINRFSSVKPQSENSISMARQKFTCYHGNLDFLTAIFLSKVAVRRFAKQRVVSVKCEFFPNCYVRGSLHFQIR